MKTFRLKAAALVAVALALVAGEVKAQCNQACPAPAQQLKVQQATYAAPVVVAQPLVVQPQLFVVPSAPTVQLQQLHVQPLVVQQVVAQPVVQKVVQQRIVQQQRVIQQQKVVQPRVRSLTIQRIRTR